jgi:KDO2-lipid IV(A) lauroyltransferase
MIAKASYQILSSFIRLISKLPFSILYRIADLFFVVGFYVIRYRKKVIYGNLKCAFPEKPDEEIDLLAKKFFRHLSDFFVESFKPLTLPTHELLNRFYFTNPEVMEELTKNNRNYAVVSGHYGNWEWNTVLSLYAGRDAIIIYRPLQNKNMDLLFKKIRSRYEGTRLTAMEHVYRTALEYKAVKKPFMIYFIADQRPPRNNKFWTTFLHQPTSFFNGTEKLSTKLDLAVIFMHIEKTKRGFYSVTLKKLFDSVIGLPENTVTLAFVDELEKEIQQRPELWLWSHKRWKYKPDENTVMVPR